MSADAKGNPEKWKGFLRGLGVSWEPKILSVSLDELSDQPNGLLDEYKRWGLGEIHRFHRSASLITGGASVFIEHFPYSLAGCPPADVFRAVQSVKPLAENGGARVRYYYQQGARETLIRESFALFQLRQSAWVPCHPGLPHLANGGGELVMVRPEDAFMPECGLGKVVPAVKKPDGMPPDEWGSVYGALKELGVRTEKPASTDKEWWRKRMGKLAQIAGGSGESADWHWKPGGRGGWADVVAHLYRAYGDSLSGMGHVPYVYKTDKGEFVAFAPLKDVRWADKPYHEDADVRRGLLDCKFKLFPFSLGKGKRFGVAPLSRYVSESIDAESCEDPRRTGNLQARLNERGEMLVLAAGIKDYSHLGEIPIRPGSPRLSESVKGYASLFLSLEFRDGSGKIPRVDVDFHINGDKLHVNAGGSQWRAFAAGIAKWCDLSETIAAVFEGLLREKDVKECHKRLRQLGIPDGEMPGPLPDSEPISPPVPPVVPGIPTNQGVTVEVTSAAGEEGTRSTRNGNVSRAQVTVADPEDKKRTEKCAVDAAVKFYEGLGFTVRDVQSAKKGWDLEVARDGREMQVEVKGRKGNSVDIILTAMEEKQSRLRWQSYRLVIVRNAQEESPACAVYQRCGEESRWKLTDEGYDGDAPSWLTMSEMQYSVKESDD